MYRLVNNLEKIRPTRDRPFSGRPRVTKPNQDRGNRPTHTGNGFESFVQTVGTLHGWHYLRISAKNGLRCLRENKFRQRKAFVGPVRDNRRQYLQLQWA